MNYTRKKLKNPNNNMNNSGGVTRVFSDFIDNYGDAEAQGRIFAQQAAELQSSIRQTALLENHLKQLNKLREESVKLTGEDTEKVKRLDAEMQKVSKTLEQRKAYEDEIRTSQEAIRSLASEETKEYSYQAREILTASENIKKEVESHNEKLKFLEEEAKVIKASGASEVEKAEKLLEIEQKQRKEENAKRKAQGMMSIEEEQLRKAGGGGLNTILDMVGMVGGEERKDGIVDALSGLGDKFLGGLSGVTQVLGTIKNIVSSLDKAMDAAVDGAAQFLDQNYTAINANLTGSSIDFGKIADKAVEELGMNRFLRQTDYLETIRNMTDAGLTFNIEERAMLQAIKDKTLHTFDATEASLTRIIRLLQRDVTATQFGTEYALRNLLNSVFGDTSYLNNLYDSVQGAIIDATVATGKGDITPFNSTVQTWLGYMYEAGLSDSVVSKIAQGINMLGSGNVQGLMSQADLQKLFLLSMDAIGLDYADVLQRGLDAETTNNLMKSMIAYLSEIATNTQDNLVLQAAYGDLFNLSVSDIKAIQNLANTDIQVVKDYSAAAAATTAAMASISENTLFSSQMNVLMDNLSYTFGSSIAESNALYATYKISDFLYDAFAGFADLGGIAGKVATVGAGVAGVTKMLTALPGLIALIGSADTIFTSSAGTFTDFLTGVKQEYPIQLVLVKMYQQLYLLNQLLMVQEIVILLLLKLVQLKVVLIRTT